MKRFFIVLAFLLLVTAVYGSDKQKLIKPINVYGETTYTQSSTKSLITTLNFEYRFKLYEPKHKKWLFFLGGKVTLDYDHFGKEMRKNAFTVIGIDF